MWAHGPARPVCFDFGKQVEQQADKVTEVISDAAKSGEIGDGKIFVAPIEHALRIRTGETDSDAL